MSSATDELLVSTIARSLEGLDHVAVGAVSPVPAAGALLARALSGGELTVSILGSRRFNSFTDGGRELFDCAAQGRIDAFFLGGAQIDGSANINLVGMGDYPKSDVRLAGSFGSAYLYFLVPRVILFAPSHSTRTLVEQVDFVSAPGHSPPNVYRPGGPRALITDRCVFAFDQERARFTLASIHRGQTLSDIREHTGFAFDAPAEVPQTPEPTARELELLRGPVSRDVAETYPAFAARLLAAVA